MKQTQKNFIISNFDTAIANKKVFKSDFKIKNIFNLTTKNGIIEPLNGFVDMFKNYLGNERYSSFVLNNCELLDSIIYTTIFEYETEPNNHERIFAIDSSLYLYELDLENLILSSINICFKHFPNILNQDGKLYIFDNSGNFIVITENYNPVRLTASPKLNYYSNCSNKSFFTTYDEPFKLFYTEQSEIENLSDELETYDNILINKDYGKILNIVTYKNSIFVVQQYAISKIYFSSKEIYQQLTCSINSKISENSICLIDDYMVFMSSAGLFLFDGNDIKQIFNTVFNNISFNNVIAKSFNNLYYLLTDINLNNNTEKVLLEFDIEKNICNIYKNNNITNIIVIQSFNHYRLAVVNKYNDSYKINYLDFNYDDNQFRYLNFNKLSFDESCIKILNRIKFNCTGNFFIKIKTENDEIKLQVTDNYEINNLGLKGQLFDIEIFSDKVFSIESIYFGLTFIEE